MVHSLKFPEGEFTHTELARFNGVSNQTAWQRYLKARQSGQIISAGTRKTEKSKGSPSLLWRVNPNWIMALMVIPQPARVTPALEVASVSPLAPQVAEVASAGVHADRTCLVNALATELASVPVVDTEDELQAELAAEMASA